MFQCKKKKIQQYLREKTAEPCTPFDELLGDNLSGKMKEKLMNLSISKIEIHIDWLPSYRCIGIQAMYDGNYLDLQIEPTEFSIGYDPVEPDQHRYYRLESREQVYSVIQQTIDPSRDCN